MQGFGVLSLAVGIVGLVLFPAQWQNVTASASAPVCTSTPPVVEKCLRHVPGQITETRSGWRSGTEHHFIPSGGPEPDAWVHLADDTVEPMPPATHELLSGARVVALYWEDEPVAFETSYGRVVPLGADLGSRTNFLWGGLVGVCLGGIGWLVPRTDKYNKFATPRPRWLLITSGVLLVGFFAGGAALLVTGEQTKLIVFGIVGTAGGVLVTWRARAHRPPRH
jgi:hypothetical protein